MKRITIENIVNNLDSLKSNWFFDCVNNNPIIVELINGKIASGLTLKESFNTTFVFDSEYNVNSLRKTILIEILKPLFSNNGRVCNKQEFIYINCLLYTNIKTVNDSWFYFDDLSDSEKESVIKEVKMTLKLK